MGLRSGGGVSLGPLRDHLIAMKRVAGRTKDRLMLEEYIAIADEERGVGGEADPR